MREAGYIIEISRAAARSLEMIKGSAKESFDLP